MAPFIQRVDIALRSPGSFVYVDTSFLMWLIRIGPRSRAEFFAWLDGACLRRVAIPTWSLHELYRHHAENTLKNDLDEQVSRLKKSVGESYSTMWTLFDEPLSGASSVAQQRDEVRDALRAVRTLTDRMDAWKAGYARNAREVMEFANERAIEGSGIFDRFSSIDILADARFTGRVPPGFQDKRKKEIESANEDGADFVIGSNRWGDLIFWQEILEHVRAHRVRTVFVLTKDMKNDWRMAGQLPVHGQADGKGIGVVPPHPMLSYEAARTAGAHEVVLLDQSRLADVMKRGPGGAASFVAAAQPPGLPPPKTDTERRNEALERRVSEDKRVAEVAASISHVRFLDPVGLEAKDGVLYRAVYETRADAPPMPEVVDFEATIQKAQGGDNAITLLTRDVAGRLGGAGLVAFTRRLLLGAESDTEKLALAGDLAAELETFPRETASFLYMGLLAGTYLDSKNKLLLTPNGAVAQKLFALLERPLASAPLAQLRRKANSAAQLPLFLPFDALPIVVEFKIDTELDQENALQELWINEHNLVIDVQSDPRLRLADRFRSTEITQGLMLDHIAALYVLPRRHLGCSGTTIDAYTVNEHMGFRDPADVWSEGKREMPS